MSFETDDAILFEGVSKRYHRKGTEVWSGDLRNDVKAMVGRLVGRKPEKRSAKITALNDVSLRVRRGENIGLVGSNGAGKSTILKLVSNITRPTAGDIWVRGRVAALIQLGAGFHRELSGRENVYLYGSILGLTRQQLDERYPSIVEFAELDDFMGAPLKHYSSGMTIRLGLAVALHVDADILLVDEVLAVGDAAFRTKSAAYIDRLLATTTVTTVMVSHDLELLRHHCSRGVWIDGGQVAFDGSIDEAIDVYLSASNRTDLRD